MQDEDHDKLVRLEERIAQWMTSVERRLGVQHRTLMGILFLMASTGLGIVLALWERAP